MKYKFKIGLLMTLLSVFKLSGQYLPHIDSVETLLDHPTIQDQVTVGINDLYNFKFERANSLFNWFKRQYPKHPLSYFLLGMSKWWQVLSEPKNKIYQKEMYAYMDTTIFFAKMLYRKKPIVEAEASFFISLAYSIKSSVLGENGSWSGAVLNSKKALKYLEITQKHKDLIPELLLGNAIYNYYVVWLPENYRALKPIFWFFKEGDKDLGLELFEQAIEESFYTRIEAIFLLLKIYLQDRKNLHKAEALAYYLHSNFPDNSYFHYYYARILHDLSRSKELYKVCSEILVRIEKDQRGYGDYISRYTYYFLGYYHYYYGQRNDAQYYFEETVRLSEKMKVYKSGYYLFALDRLARMASLKDKALARTYYKKIMKYADKKYSIYKSAKKKLKELKK